ncbi:Acetyl esterase/lipase [Geosmithia morbida]|uniref:Acetyl esterase/lipase n=1 Tax=Geosmithia morbida TaxID=1094350 RepID=A0A9P5D0C7_9HYPO|nr:Acetyl esterase/lipase [Geosmithia morbida]KAF4121472.1 Acetyl esterase/lipase [Geosmithia morbida]
MVLTNPLVRFAYIFLVAPWQFSLPVLRQLVLGLVPQGRPSTRWTLRQTMAVTAIKSMLRVSSVLQRRKVLSLQPGTEGSRFTVVPPADDTLYVGPLADEEVRPCAVGGTWTPSEPPRVDAGGSGDDEKLRVVLHFHGGAFVIGDGRDHDTGFTADILRTNGGFTHVFTPQYRLAVDAETRFPAQLQDAVSAYLHLTRKLGIPASNIVIGGDSAGGNLALALIRYIHDHGEDLSIPWPSAALLWSPWTDLTSTHDPVHVRNVANFSTDYLAEGFAVWGTECITGAGKIPADSPYLSPGVSEPFRVPLPIWVHTGGSEVLFGDNKLLVQSFRSVGNNVDWYVDDLCPHDIALLGKVLGWEKEARDAAAAANKFLTL